MAQCLITSAWDCPDCTTKFSLPGLQRDEIFIANRSEVSAFTEPSAGLVSAYAKGYWIAVPEGTIAALPWIPKQNREGKDTKVNSYGNMLNPVDNVQYAIHSYELRADGTGQGGYTQDVVEETQISLDIAYEVAPLSVATETPLMAFALV